MKSKQELIADYSEDKAIVVGPPHLQTGLEPFPSFRDWFTEYHTEFWKCHQTVTVKEADRLAEQAQAEHDGKTVVRKPKTNRRNPMTEENMLAALEAEQDVSTPDLADNAAMVDGEPIEASADEIVVDTEEPTKQQNRRTSIRRPTTTNDTPARTATKPASKASRARVIFNEMWNDVAAGKAARKEVIARFKTEVDMTNAGASTYYQQFKKKMEAGTFEV